MSKPDRTVHARSTGNGEPFQIVRYDRAGKWWIESPMSCRRVSVRVAAETACSSCSLIFPGLPGGAAFDRIVDRILR